MKQKFKVVASLLGRIGIVVLIVLFYRCPIKLIFKADCPGCGMTRAILSALKFDFKAAFAFHPLWLPFGILFLYALFSDYFRKWIPINSKIESAVGIAFSLLMIAVWILRNFILV